MTQRELTDPPRHRQGGIKVGDRKGVSRSEAAGAFGPGAGRLPGGAAPGSAQPSPPSPRRKQDRQAVRAMRQSEQATARRYLRLFRWLLTGILALCLLSLLPARGTACWHLYDRLGAPKRQSEAPTRHRHRDRPHRLPFWSWLRLPLLAAAAPGGLFVLAPPGGRLEKRLRTRILSPESPPWGKFFRSP